MNPTWEDPIDDDNEENAYDRGTSFGRDAVIFLIDATQEMHESGNEEDIPFHLCLKCARATLTNKIISSNKDLQAIVLFGTDKSKGTAATSEFKGVYVFHDLGEPSAERILEVDEILNLAKPEFIEKYGNTEDFSLADALWLCSIMFSNCSYTLGHKRVLLFTAVDSPHENNQQLQIQTRTKAKDMFDNNIDIDLMHIQKPNKFFDVSKFYKNIIFTSDDESYKLPVASEKFDELLVRVRCKDHKKRPLASLKLTLGEDLNIGVSLYKLILPARKPSAVKLSKENNAELASMTKTFLADTLEILLDSDLKKFQEYCGRKIYFDNDEVKQIRNLAAPGLVLMGFKPQSHLKSNHHIRPCIFVYPDEKTIEGSIRLFFALLHQCQKRSYMPICRVVLRQNDPPKFVALLPQEEKVDSHGSQTVPPGFQLVYLPFMEDIRNIIPEPKHNPSESLVEKAKEIIKKLQFAYHPESFENPVLQKHWRNIEALALNGEAPEEIIDYTLPTKDVIEKRAGKLIEEFKTLLCPGNEDPNVGDKRQMSGAYGSSAKRARVEDAIVPVNLQREASSGQLAQYKAYILKEFCKRNGIRCGSKKADLIQAIQMYYNICQ